MIDTDKYEGHYTYDFARFWVTADDVLNADIERANATTNLIDDAPHLLAEVKRLREQGRKLVEAAERVRSEISDQDTGWYYQLGNHIEKMNRLVKE